MPQQDFVTLIDCDSTIDDEFTVHLIDCDSEPDDELTLYVID
jgi:hypothetical protein